MSEKKKDGGTLIYRFDARREITMQIIPHSSGSPLGSYAAKHELTKDELSCEFAVLRERYPPPAFVEK